MLRYLKFEDEGINPDLIVHWRFRKATEEGQEDELDIDLSAPAFEARPIPQSSCYRQTFIGEAARIIYGHLCKEAVELTPRRRRDT